MELGFRCNECRPKSGGVRCLTPFHPHTYTLDTCSSKDQSFYKGAIYMVPKPNLGDNSIYTLCHGPPYVKMYFLRGESKLIAGTCAHIMLDTESCVRQADFLKALPFPSSGIMGFFFFFSRYTCWGCVGLCFSLALIRLGLNLNLLASSLGLA